MRAALLLPAFALAACSSGDRANKPSDAGAALNSLAPAATPDNEAAAAGAVDNGTTNYPAGDEATPDPAGNQYNRR